MTQTPAWIAADWGTSNARFWAIDGNGIVLDERTSDKGMGSLAPSEFEGVLDEICGDWLSTADTVVACGMVGSRQGWVEAPYQTAPCAVCPDTMVKAPVSRAGLNVHVIPGIRQTNPADVMRGEETQIAGFLSLNPQWDGVICMPGTHTKWVHLSAGEVVSFQTYMTGEMFALLSEASVLRHSIRPGTWDDGAFRNALDDSLSRPERTATKLFALRAGDLLNLTDPDTTRATLSGYLIGLEIAAARTYWLGQNLAILGMNHQAQAYQTALSAQGVPATMVDTERATLAGLTAAHRQLKART